MIAGPWTIELDSFDGQVAKIFSRDGKPEMWITAFHEDEMQRLVVPMVFNSIELAERAGQVLRDAMREVELIRLEQALSPDDGHEHRIRPQRYSRAGGARARCEICDADLGELPFGFMRARA